MRTTRFVILFVFFACLAAFSYDLYQSKMAILDAEWRADIAEFNYQNLKKQVERAERQRQIEKNLQKEPSPVAPAQ